MKKENIKGSICMCVKNIKCLVGQRDNTIKLGQMDIHK